MKRILAILIALVAGFALDSAVIASVEADDVSSSLSVTYRSELAAETMAQIECARNYNSDLKLPTVPSVTAPQYVERTLRNEFGSERHSIGSSEVRAAGAGRNYISTKPLSRLFVGKAPSDYLVSVLCRLRI